MAFRDTYAARLAQRAKANLYEKLWLTAEGRGLGQRADETTVHRKANGIKIITVFPMTLEIETTDFQGHRPRLLLLVWLKAKPERTFPLRLIFTPSGSSLDWKRLQQSSPTAGLSMSLHDD